MGGKKYLSSPPNQKKNLQRWKKSVKRKRRKSWNKKVNLETRTVSCKWYDLLRRKEGVFCWRYSKRRLGQVVGCELKSFIFSTQEGSSLNFEEQRKVGFAELRCSWNGVGWWLRNLCTCTNVARGTWFCFPMALILLFVNYVHPNLNLKKLPDITWVWFSSTHDVFVISVSFARFSIALFTSH